MLVCVSSRVKVPVEVREGIGFPRVGVTGDHEPGCCGLNLVLLKCRGSSHLLSYRSTPTPSSKVLTSCGAFQPCNWVSNWNQDSNSLFLC